MRVTIIPSDEHVYVEGEAHTVDMSDMPYYVHAVQWHGAHGEVEFKKDDKGRKVPNLRFEDFKPFEYMVDRWRQRKQYVDEKAKREESERAEARQIATEAYEAARSEKIL